MRYRQGPAAGLTLVALQVFPQVFGSGTIKIAERDGLSGLFCSVPEYNNAMQVVSIRRRCPLEAGHGSETPGLIVLVGDLYKLIPDRARQLC